MEFKVMEPPIRQKLEGEHGINREWAEWIGRIYRVTHALSTSGATRPTKLYVGQMFFDTSLGLHGKPIWVGSGGVWVDSTGASV